MCGIKALCNYLDPQNQEIAICKDARFRPENAVENEIWNVSDERFKAGARGYFDFAGVWLMRVKVRAFCTRNRNRFYF